MSRVPASEIELNTVGGEVHLSDIVTIDRLLYYLLLLSFMIRFFMTHIQSAKGIVH